MTASAADVFATERLVFRYPESASAAIDGLDYRVERGGFHAIIGPNGSGKSTLLRVLLGLLPPSSGRALYLGRDVASWPPADRARALGVVAQQEEFPFPITVRELVGMGRYPHLGAWRAPGPADRAAVSAALERCDVAAFADRPVTTLSGGERQRARLARALAQEPRTLVLDEPTAALDIAHEMTMFDLLAGLCTNDGVTVLIVTHNVNLAARYARHLLLLDAGRAAAAGAPTEVITRSNVERVYRWPVSIQPHPGPGKDAGTPQIVPLARAGGTLNRPPTPLEIESDST
jgi:iron complex transport system ATP-binding protein